MSKKRILAISGKKQAGKNTMFNFLLGLEMIRSALVRGRMTVTKTGDLWVSDLWGDEGFQGIFDPHRKTENMVRFKAEFLDPFIREYSFADILKRDVCIGVLGLGEEQCYGTDEQKNSPTHLLWENMPGIVVPKIASGILSDVCGHGEDPYEISSLADGNLPLTCHEEGPMTAREVMQYIGTEIFRKMYNNVWADSTIRRIQSNECELSIITDCRFPNEVKAVQDAGGKVIRLTRDIYEGEDQHTSETALDKDKYDWDNFDHIIDNNQMTVDEQNIALHKILIEWGWIEANSAAESIA